MWDGTTRLPCAGMQPESSRCVSPAAGENSPIILMVDDDPSLRMLFERYLTLLGYTPLFASNGEEALSIARDTPKIRLIILDVVMPGLSGQRLAELLVDILPGAPILFSSGHPTNALARLGIDIKDAQFMQKPCRPLELKQRLSEMLAAR
jgi:CheY-like chemotaxis protein